MASRTQNLVVRPWQGGLNTSLDSALLTPDELTVADNVVFSASKSRKTRGALAFWDYIATSVSREASGTSRFLIVSMNSGSSLNIGEYISVRKANGEEEADYEVTRVQVTGVDTVTYSPNVLITYDTTTNLTEAVTADDTFVIGEFLDERVLCIADYWYASGGSQQHARVAVTSEGRFYSYDQAGSKSRITLDGSVTLSAPITGAQYAVLNNTLIITFSDTGNKPVKWSGSGSVTYVTNKDISGADVTASNPVPDICNVRVWQGRLWGIDKTTDRIHYSDIAEPERWNGEGDSGAIDLPVGDGDKTGLTSIFPPFKGQLPIAKNGVLGRITGTSPFYQVETISAGIGCVSHESAVAMDLDDVLFASNKGFHSFLATDAFGDFNSTFISTNIQSDYAEIAPEDRNDIRGIYLPNLSSVAWAVKEAGNSENNAIYLVNIEKGAEGITPRWYRWAVDHDSARFVSMSIFQEGAGDRLVFGTHQGRIISYDTDLERDLVSTAITTNVKTGIIYPDNNPTMIKGFKRIGVLYKTERQAIEFILKFKVDNYDNQEITISQSPSSDLLGSSFTLGSSTLGSKEILLPENIGVDGYGYGCIIELESSVFIDIYGYTIEYEVSGDQQEVIRS